MITAQDKIIKFANLDELKDAIVQDLSTRDVNAQRYCVRFIMLNNFATFRDLTMFLVKELNVNLFELQNLTLGADKTITIDMLSDAVKGITENSLITPFSELVRFYKESDFNGFFNEIILTEDLRNSSKRIYVPIIGLNNRFNDFLKSFGRIEESAPIWQLYSQVDDKIKVFVTKFKTPTLPENSEFCILETMRDWMNFWRKQAPRDKILCSAFPIRFGWKNSRPDSIFTFTEITNPYEYLTDFLGVHIPFEYKESENEYWERIQGAVSDTYDKVFSWKTYVETHFNIRKIDFKVILDKWAYELYTDYDRWLLKNYLLHTDQLKDKPYIKLCLTETTDYVVPATFFVNLAERIFYLVNQPGVDKFYDERKQLMSEERSLFRELVPKDRQEWLMDHIIDVAQSNDGFAIVKKLSTGTFEFEKELFFGWYQKRSEHDFGLKHLKEFYPDLHAYLNATDVSIYRPGAEWLADYFNAYRAAKVNNVYSDDVRGFIETQNASEKEFWDWYYKHNSCHDLFHEHNNDELRRPDKVYWIDGLGAEFIPYIQYLIETIQSNYEIIEVQVATTGLPSNTSLNRFVADNKFVIKFGDLDALAHGSHYKERKTLISELSTLRHIIEQILKDNSVGHHTIALVSDHGLSALSRLCEPCKLSGKAHHEGRYIPFAADIAAGSMPEYVTVNNPDDKQDYMVALTHSSLGSRPSHEVHGGCTPEEVLVPFIVITTNDASKPIKYDVEPTDLEVPLSSPVFKCVILPQPKSAHLIINGTKVSMEVNNTTWSATIPHATEGKVLVSVIPERGRQQNFEVKVFGLGLGNSIIEDFDL